MTSQENLVRAVRQIRFAVCLCPLSALFCTPICSLTTRNFCISCRFVFFRGRTAVSYFSSVFLSEFAMFRRGQLAPCTPRRAEPARPQLPAARILQPLPASPKNFPFCAFLPLSAFPPYFLFPSHASCPFSSNASALYPLFIAKYLINPLRFSSKLCLFKRIFATFQHQS